MTGCPAILMRTLPYTYFMAMPLTKARARLAAAAILALGGMTSAAISHASSAGPEIGSKIPAFEAVDQFGETRNLGNLSGEKGLLLLFFRSADW